MGKPLDHANGSVKKWGGVSEDYLSIHEFIDSSKIAIPDNRHRALTHNAWFITVVLERVFGQKIKNSSGRTVYVRDIGEQHCFEDFGGKFIPTAQDYLEEMNPASWMGIGGGLPGSAKRFEKSLTGSIGSGIPMAYPLAIEPPLDRAILVPIYGSLFDTESINIGESAEFFVRPQGQKKTRFDTNIWQSNLLDYPREFSVTGFAVLLGGDRAGEVDRSGVTVEFSYSSEKNIFTLNQRAYPVFDTHHNCGYRNNDRKPLWCAVESRARELAVAS